jgi:hypothetical protein
MRSIACPLVASAVLAACGGTPPDAYATYQACFDDHTMVEALPVPEAIVVCCLEHPIAGVKPSCGATAAACTDYLGINLSATSATPAEVTAACADYITQKGP